jgi:hypothetical protein
VSEAGEMYEQLNKWLELINRLQLLALEMESHEQDVNYLNHSIAQLMDEPEDDYFLTFHDHRSPKMVKLTISWSIVPFNETEDTSESD